MGAKQINFKKHHFNIQYYVSIYNGSNFWDFNVLPQFEIERDGMYIQIFLKFFIFGLEITYYKKQRKKYEIPI